MRSRFHPMFYVILPLAALGFVYQIQSIVQSLLIPLALIVVLFLLYWLSKGRTGQSATVRRPKYNPNSAAARRQKPDKLKPKRGPTPFRVIDGRKDKDGEPPKYH
jgi:hypothetical protein